VSDPANPGFSELPAPAKLGLGGAALAVIGGAGFLIRDHPKAAIILVIGLVLVIALVIAFGKLGALKQKSKAKVFSTDLSAQFRATPQQVTNADSRAKLDDLRRKLQEGFDKLAATGKSPYVLPWYMMVGEPGSGKTKAIAAANVALPGFQDPLQGTGGTVNMNWWFTNNGLILDTAGRLMLPEVPTSNNPEWDEFLRTLNVKRPDCPINGLLLAIPADTLITDNEEKIYRKAGEIALQFNKIQSTLGIRFPVFVLITKCDKILGFREFFECFSSPEEQAQLMGWSNPDKLDDPFRPELVEQHLEKVHAQLVRRRLRLIENPVNTEDPAARRLDQVDALYELPDALLAIAPRLRRYLEPIFVAGPLSSRPLFLRGIYFTSSLQTGEALDKAISAIMGVDIVAAHGGPVVAEKPYFLRHVFQEKVFKEKGLVTRTSNVAQLKRRRKLAVIGAGFASVLALGGLTWLGNSQLKKRIENPTHFWTNVATAQADAQAPLNIIGPDGRYRGDQTVRPVQLPLVKVHDQAINAPDIHVPIIFQGVSLAQTGHFDPNGNRRLAYHDLFESTVVRPVISRAEDQVTNEPGWSPQATVALRQLMLIEAGAKLDPSRYTDSLVPLTPLSEYVLSKDDQKSYARDQETWEKAFNELYLAPKDPFPWPPTYKDDKRGKAIQAGVTKFLAYIDQQASQSAHQREAFKSVADLLAELERAEQALIDPRVVDIKRDPNTTYNKNREAMDQWKRDDDALHKARGKLESVLTQIKDWHPAAGAPPELASYFTQLLDQDKKSQQAQCDKLIVGVLDQLPPNAPDVMKKAAFDLQTKRKESGDLAQAAGNPEIIQTIKKYEGTYLATDKKGTRRYILQDDLLAPVNEQVPSDVASAAAASATLDFPDVPTALANLDKTHDQVSSGIDAEVEGFKPDDREGQLARSAKELLELGIARKRSQTIEVALKALPDPGSREDWHALVKTRVSTGDVQVKRSALPMTDAELGRSFPDIGYDPDQFAAARKFWDQLGDYAALKSKQPKNPDKTPILDYDDLNNNYTQKFKAWNGYIDSFQKYWTADIFEAMKPQKDLTWTDVQAGLADLKVKPTVQQLADAQRQQSKAVANQAPTVPIDKLTNVVDASRESWAALGGLKTIEARDQVLKQNSADFASAYLLRGDATQGNEPTLAERYWQGIFAAAFKTLATEAGKETLTAARSLQKLERFPLAKPGSQPELTWPELKKAQDLIKQVSPASVWPAESVAMHGRIEFRDLRDAIDEMKGAKALTPEDAEWISTIRPFLDVLAANQLKCRVTLIPTGIRYENKVSARQLWIYANVRANGASPDPLFPEKLSIDGTGDRPDADRGAQLPGLREADGKDLQLILFPVGRDDKADPPITIAAGHWPALRLITHDANRTVTTDDPDSLQFKVEYRINGQYVFPLKVEYTVPRTAKDFKLPAWFIPQP
jgi:hypothetical protein